jgi:hypothetical protein
MNPRIARSATALASLVFASAAALALAGCASTDAVEQEQVIQTADGTAVVDTITYVATVTAVDAARRKVTLTTPDGKSGTFKADKTVDMSGFKVGQQIGIQATEAVAIQFRKGGTPAQNPAAVALTAVGTDGRSGAVFEGEAVEIQATIVAIDPAKRQVTLQLPDGTAKAVKAPKGADLSQISVGETIILDFADSVIIAVSNP